METRNLTLSLSTDLLRRAKVVAAQRGSSLSSLVTQILEELVAREDGYEEAWDREKALIKRGLSMRVGEITWTRDELHER